jgi:hypothetical protein
VTSAGSGPWKGSAIDGNICLDVTLQDTVLKRDNARASKPASVNPARPKWLGETQDFVHVVFTAAI